MRQHVNPLSRYFQEPLVFPSLNEMFIEPDLPLHIDIGSARGRFLLDMAIKVPSSNYLGIEIREPLVLQAEEDRIKGEIPNLKFLFANVNVSLPPWLKTIPKEVLDIISIQFPDPWFKRRHFKRRVIQPELIDSFSTSFLKGKRLFMQSDVIEIIQEMKAIVDSKNIFMTDNEKNLLNTDNPFPCKTQREIYVRSKNLPIYRLLYTKR